LIQTFNALRVHDRVVIFLGAVFTPAVLAAGEIKVHKDMLKLLAPNQIQQRHLISGFEWFCGSRHPSIMKFFPVILKELYDEEIVEEDVFYAWSTDIIRNEHTVDASMISYEVLEQLRNSAKPFITWLQHAEEEGEDGEEEDGSDEVEDTDV
jgi:translation initiation factor 5